MPPVRALLVVMLCALVVAPAAGATIVPQRSIAGIRLHMTKTQVRAKLGTPKRLQNGRNDFGRYTTFVYPRVTVTFQSGAKVTGLRTRSPRERTASGVGVGSTEAKVKAGVPAAVCKTESGVRQCVVGMFKPGRTVTSFLFKHGRVSDVVVGIVID